jgi:RecA-family ATPase
MKDKIFNHDQINETASNHGIIKNFIPSDLKPIDYDQIKKDIPKPAEHVLYPCIANPSLNFIYAATGVGKTLFTLNIAYCIASGGTFLNYRAPKPKKVLYVDAEMPYNQVYSRIMQIAKQQGELALPKNFMLFTPDKVLPYFLPKICDLEGQSFYNNQMEENGTNVLIIDNLSMLSSIDENKAVEWKIIQDWIVKLRSKGITIIIVHHAGKEKNGYRGTSRMLDAADTAISLQDLNSESLECEISNVRKFKIDYQKHRNFNGKDALSFEVTLTPSGWQFQSIEKTNMDMVIERVKIGMSHKDISIEMGVSRPYVSKLFSIAKKQGLIED